MRRAGRKDWNQTRIVAALRSIGVTVFVLNQEGLPDLLCASRGELRLLECKTPRGRLTALRRATFPDLPVAVVRSEQDALAIFGVKA